MSAPRRFLVSRTGANPYCAAPRHNFAQARASNKLITKFHRLMQRTASAQALTIACDILSTGDESTSIKAERVVE
jgi:hypothetical protein